MSAQPFSILLVDNEQGIHVFVGLFLREAGYSVGHAKDGLEGLRMYKDRSWDLVITDRVMPGMDGEQLAEKIRNASDDTPLILMTGLLKSDTRVELFDEILLKPFKRADLLAAVDRALRKRLHGCLG